MTRQALPITGGFYESDSLPLSAQECTNLYVNIPETQGLGEGALFNTPGLTQVDTSGASPDEEHRGAYVLNGTPYFVIKDKLYKLSSGSLTAITGTLNSTTGRVSMAENGTQLMILEPGADGYIFTEPDTLTQITDTDFTTTNGTPQHVVFIDGYFCCTTDSKKFKISGLNDGLTWSALDFGTAESSPDDTVAPIVFKNQLFIGGTKTIEAFTNVGASGSSQFPFQRSGLFLSTGVTSPFSVVVAQDTFMFVGGGINASPSVYMFVENTTQKVSTRAIDELLQDLTQAELADLFGWFYAEGGSYFVGFSLPATSIVYDLTTGRWHERQSQVTNPDQTVDIKRWRINSLVTAAGSTYCGDSEDGRVGMLERTNYQEYGADINRRFATQPFQNLMAPFFVPMLELTVESGVGNADITAPVVSLEISTDGGKTWTDPRTRPMGELGEYFRRAIWRRNGRVSRFVVYRFTMSDPCKTVVIQLTADIQAAA